jgi:hypothetical protein
MLVAVVALLVWLVLLGSRSDQSKQLLRTGARTTGVVLSYHRSRLDKNIAVEYVAAGQLHRGVINLNDSSPTYQPGERVDVIYDPRDPARIRTPQEENQSSATTALLVWGLCGLVVLFTIAIQALHQVRKWRRRLTANPWRAYAVTYLPGRPLRSVPGVELVPIEHPEAEPVVLMLGMTGLERATKLATQRLLWLAGDPASDVVLSPPNSGDLFPALPPSGYAGRRFETAQQRVSAQPFNRLYVLTAGLVELLGAAVLVALHHWLLAPALALKGSIMIRAFLRTPADAHATETRTPVAG